VGLYLNPPEAAVVLSVDEKSQVQALAHSQPAFQMMPGMPEKRTHDYLRHGTTSLFAAFNTADGTVISSLPRRHRATEFKKFLAKIDDQVPDDLKVHLVCDNYGTHKHPSVNRWLEAHPRFHLHFTPTYSSWIIQVERFFAFVTADLLQRSDHRSVQALEADIRNWIKTWNESPKPFVWTKTADQTVIARWRGDRWPRRRPSRCSWKVRGASSLTRWPAAMSSAACPTTWRWAWPAPTSRRTLPGSVVTSGPATTDGRRTGSRGQGS